MSAEKFDSPLRWLVSSDSRKGIKHLVELDAWEGNGACACEHFSFALCKRLQAGAEIDDELTRCHHIRTARDALVSEIIFTLSQQEKKKAEANENDRRKEPAKRLSKTKERHETF